MRPRKALLRGGGKSLTQSIRSGGVCKGYSFAEGDSPTRIALMLRFFAALLTLATPLALAADPVGSFSRPQFAPYRGTTWTCQDGTTGNESACIQSRFTELRAAESCDGHCDSSGRCGVKTYLRGQPCGDPLPYSALPVNYQTFRGSNWLCADGSFEGEPQPRTDAFTRAMASAFCRNRCNENRVCGVTSYVSGYSQLPDAFYSNLSWACWNGSLGSMPGCSSEKDVLASGKLTGCGLSRPITGTLPCLSTFLTPPLKYRNFSWTCQDGTIGSDPRCAYHDVGYAIAKTACRNHCASGIGEWCIRSFSRAETCDIGSAPPKPVSPLGAVFRGLLLRLR